MAAEWQLIYGSASECVHQHLAHLNRNGGQEAEEDDDDHDDDDGSLPTT